MSQPLDPFTQSFDSIDVDRSAFSRVAFEQALGAYGPRAPKVEPGFTLLDDAQGRFVVDRHMGVISLANAALIEQERGTVHDVRLHVVEQSGVTYELPVKLRITGLIPSMVGAENFDFSGDAPVDTTPAPLEAATPAIGKRARRIAWTSYSVACCEIGKAALGIEGTPFTAALEPLPTPAAPGPFRLHLFTPLPEPSTPDAAWSL